MEQKMEEKIIIAKLEDKIKRCIIKNKIENTEFLNLYQKKIIQQKLNELKFKNYIFNGGFEEAENQILVLYPEKLSKEIVERHIHKVIKALQIDLPNEVYGKYQHKDYLSTVMKIGLERERIGDIIVYQDKAYIIVLNENAEYIKNSLQEFIKFKKAKIEITDVNQIKSKSPELKEIEIHISSNRLDCIVAEIARVSRSKAEQLIKDEKVSINCKFECKNTKQISKKDILIIRGSGKYIISEIYGNNKTKKIIVKLHKYI